MNITYKKNLLKNFVMLSNFENTDFVDTFSTKMLTNNHITGLLSTELQYINNIPYLLYDISSKHSLSSLIQNSLIGFELFKSIMISLINICETLEEFLLETKYLMLSPELIFINPETKIPYFCLCPCLSSADSTFIDKFRNLLCYILTKLDHNDNLCVIAAYKIQHLSLDDNFSINTIFDIINNSFDDAKKQETAYNIYENSSFDNLNNMLLEENATDSQKTSIFELPVKYLSSLFKKKTFTLEDNQTTNYVSNNCDSTSTIGDTMPLTHTPNASIPHLVYSGADFSSDTIISHFPFTIGKIQDNVDMIIENPMISRIHARIYCRENDYYLEDMNSSNGTYLNSTLLYPHSVNIIKDGDCITFSHLSYLFKLY